MTRLEYLAESVFLKEQFASFDIDLFCNSGSLYTISVFFNGDFSIELHGENQIVVEEKIKKLFGLDCDLNDYEPIEILTPHLNLPGLENIEIDYKYYFDHENYSVRIYSDEDWFHEKPQKKFDLFNHDNNILTGKSREEVLEKITNEIKSIYYDNLLICHGCEKKHIIKKEDLIQFVKKRKDNTGLFVEDEVVNLCRKAASESLAIFSKKFCIEDNHFYTFLAKNRM